MLKRTESKLQASDEKRKQETQNESSSNRHWGLRLGLDSLPRQRITLEACQQVCQYNAKQSPLFEKEDLKLAKQNTACQ